MFWYYIFSYFVVGACLFNGIVFIHKCSAESQGYWAFDYWEVAGPEIRSRMSKAQMLWSIIIWPIRTIQFISLIDMFYDIYDYRKSGPRKRRRGL